jgi:hypothetical protein
MDYAGAKFSRTRARNPRAVRGVRNAATGIRGGGMVGNPARAQRTLVDQVILGLKTGAEFGMDGQDFRIAGESFEKQLETATPLWQTESNNVENIIRAEVQAATTAPRNDQTNTIIYNCLNQLYAPGQIEDNFLATLERRLQHNRSMLNIKQLTAVTAGIATGGLFAITF